MLCAISYHLQNLRNVENILHGCFSRFLNFANGTKLRKASLYSQVLSFLKQKSYKSSLFECDLGLFFFLQLLIWGRHIYQQQPVLINLHWVVVKLVQVEARAVP